MAASGFTLLKKMSNQGGRASGLNSLAAEYVYNNGTCSLGAPALLLRLLYCRLCSSVVHCAVIEKVGLQKILMQRQNSKSLQCCNGYKSSHGTMAPT